MVTLGVEQRIAKRRDISDVYERRPADVYSEDVIFSPGSRALSSPSEMLRPERRSAGRGTTLLLAELVDDDETVESTRRTAQFEAEARREAYANREAYAHRRERPRWPEPALQVHLRNLGDWLPVAVAAIICLFMFAVYAQALRDYFVYPPAGFLALPADGQTDPSLMEFAVPGWTPSAVAGDSGVAEESASQAVSPPPDLTRFEALKLTKYTVKPGDAISVIAKKFGIHESTIISFNDISDVRRIPAGATFQIPNRDGLRYTVRRGDSLSSISKRFGVSVNGLLDANNLKTTVLHVGQDLFVPGAEMNAFQLKLILGEAFRWPVRGAVLTSPFGFRPDPFTGVRDFHNGIDLALYYGAPIHAAGNGTVKDVGYNSIFGYYIIISHPNNFQTLYGHLSKQLVRPGQRVAAGQTIGLMGSTGYSTGTHLHFTIYHNYKPVNPLRYLPKG